jgi:hypothetical protein
MAELKKPLLKSEIMKDWVTITSLLLGGSIGYQSVNSNYFLYGNLQFDSADFLAALIDSVIGTALTFSICVAILGSIRRRSSKSQELIEDLENRSKFFKLRILLAILIVSLGALFAAYSNATARNPDVGTARGGAQVEMRPRTCSLQGEDEKCVSAIGVGQRATLDFELYYKEFREVYGYQIASSTWVIDVDCETKLVTASQLKYFDSNNVEVEFPADIVENALIGIQSDYLAALDEC